MLGISPGSQLKDVIMFGKGTLQLFELTTFEHDSRELAREWSRRLGLIVTGSGFEAPDAMFLDGGAQMASSPELQ